MPMLYNMEYVKIILSQGKSLVQAIRKGDLIKGRGCSYHPLVKDIQELIGFKSVAADVHLCIPC